MSVNPKTKEKHSSQTNSVDELFAGQINVALFCGGRGSAALIREFLRWPQIRLSLMVNGYDDGLSTGELRRLVPNMLGPSDFRKNLSRLLDLHSTEQYALQRLIEFRFPEKFSATDVEAFEAFVRNAESSPRLPTPLDGLFKELEPRVKKVVLKHIERLLDYKRNTKANINYPDCSLGNLIFAGAYLESDNFNDSVKNLASLFASWSEIINVTKGENRTLVALKQNGQVLGRESEIVDKQDDSPIAEIYLIDDALGEEKQAELAKMTVEEKRHYLANLDMDVTISPEADRTLRNADVIVYGPGTQYSSLLPSYRTIGLPDAISESRASTKIFVANLEYDHDIQNLTVSDLVDNALKQLGDPNGERNLITHIFCDTASETRASGVRAGAIEHNTYKSAKVVRANFENAAKEGIHNGHTVVRHAIDIYEEARHKDKLGGLEIWVDLRNRVPAIPQVLEEFSNLPWDENFESVHLKLSQMPSTIPKLPPYATISSTEYSGDFTEVDALLNWLSQSEAEYLVTLTGDGEYRLSDVFIAVQILKIGVFGAVHGSRVQSRHQFRSALNSAYGENSLLHLISFCGAFVFTAAFALLFRVILSDPFTGFRVYKRRRFSAKLCEALRKRGSAPPATVSRTMIRHGVEIAEIPVTYRTFRGFTRPSYRIVRGLRNLVGLFY